MENRITVVASERHAAGVIGADRSWVITSRLSGRCPAGAGAFAATAGARLAVDVCTLHVLGMAIVNRFFGSRTVRSVAPEASPEAITVAVATANKKIALVCFICASPQSAAPYVSRVSCPT